MTITQRLTAMGAIGIIFIFMGPIAVGYAYWSWTAYLQTMISQPYISFNPPMTILVAAVVGSFMSLASLPMIILGREFVGSELMGRGRREPI